MEEQIFLTVPEAEKTLQPGKEPGIKVYTVQEVAKILKVKKDYVYELIYAKKLKAFRLSERRFRVSEEALREFIRQEEKRAG
ncbi:MAG TPA: helix-turn-helix domain-containing protein [Syntrophomonadaceae bacterium]|nr:helix-turn-helix domain-containing protein [Syntrophomonadaceae bacterium]